MQHGSGRHTAAEAPPWVVRPPATAEELLDVLNTYRRTDSMTKNAASAVSELINKQRMQIEWDEPIPSGSWFTVRTRALASEYSTTPLASSSGRDASGGGNSSRKRSRNSRDRGRWGDDDGAAQGSMRAPVVVAEGYGRARNKREAKHAAANYLLGELLRVLGPGIVDIVWGKTLSRQPLQHQAAPQLGTAPPTSAAFPPGFGPGTLMGPPPPAASLSAIPPGFGGTSSSHHALSHGGYQPQPSSSSGGGGRNGNSGRNGSRGGGGGAAGGGGGGDWESQLQQQYPLVYAHIEQLKRRTAPGASAPTPLMLLNQYAGHAMLVVRTSERRMGHSGSGWFTYEYDVVTKVVQSPAALGTGTARAKRDAKQLGAADALEQLLRSCREVQIVADAEEDGTAGEHRRVEAVAKRQRLCTAMHGLGYARVGGTSHAWAGSSGSRLQESDYWQPIHMRFRCVGVIGGDQPLEVLPPIKERRRAAAAAFQGAGSGGGSNGVSRAPLSLVEPPLPRAGGAGSAPYLVPVGGHLGPAPGAVPLHRAAEAWMASLGVGGGSGRGAGLGYS